MLADGSMKESLCGTNYFTRRIPIPVIFVWSFSSGFFSQCVVLIHECITLPQVFQAGSSAVSALAPPMTAAGRAARRPAPGGQTFLAGPPVKFEPSIEMSLYRLLYSE